MFARYVIAAAALVALVATGAVTNSALAQTNGGSQAAPAKPMMKKSMHKGGGHMAKEGHKMDNIADKLNACEMKPQSERQGCINDATR